MTSSTTTTISPLWATWRRRRRYLGVALMTCALVLGAYLLWTSTSDHVVEHRPNDFWQSRVDRASADTTRQLVSSNVRGLCRTQLATKDEGKTFISDQLHDLNKQASNHRISLLGNSAFYTSRQMSVVYNNNVQQVSVTLSEQGIRPVTQRHEEHEVISPQEHIGRMSATAAERNFSRYKNSRRRNRWRLQNLRAVETSSLSNKNSNRPESLPLRNAASVNVSRSVPSKNDATPTPIYIVVPMDEKVTESVDDFREPEVVIRSGDADMPRNGRVPINTYGVASEFGPRDRKRSPLLGALLGGPGNCRVYNTRNEVPELVDFAAGVECLDLATTPTVVVCPYPNTDDRHLSEPLRTYGVWEPHILRLFQAALLKDNEFSVYDIGANIGQYSLLAAAMGRKVVAVELHRPNIYRLHKAIRVGRLENKIVVVENGVSDERETFELQVKDGDPSGVQLTTQDADKFCNEPECPLHATTILLDDLLEVTNFKAAVMKIDVEGYEHRAFAHAEELLSDVRVAYIFMDWVKMREFYGSDVDDSSDKRLVQRMIDTLASHQYLPYGVTNAPVRILDRHKWYLWPDDIVWVLAGSVEPKELAESAPDVPSSRR